MIGQRAGHTIHLETEEVIRIKKIKKDHIFVVCLDLINSFWV